MATSLAADVRDRVVDALYGAVADEREWPRALTLMTESLHGLDAIFRVWNAARGTTAYSAMIGRFRWPAGEIQQAYGRHFGTIDPRRRYLDTLPVGQILACHERFREAFVRTSEYYNDFLLPVGGRYILETRLLQVDELSLYLAVHRTPKQGPFDVAAQRLFAGLRPHMQRASALWYRAASLRRDDIMLATALDLMDDGVVLADADGRVLIENRSAAAILRRQDGLRIRFGRLVAGSEAETAALGTALRAVARPRPLRTRALRIARRGHAQPYAVLVVPIEFAPGALAVHGQAASMLVIAELGGLTGAADAEAIAAFFDVTPAEARLAADIAVGVSPERHAATHGLSINTVRTRLKHVFRKLGVDRQAQLARLIACVPHPPQHLQLCTEIARASRGRSR